MCGIIGIADTSPTINTSNKKKFFAESLIVDQLRGFDSTGIFMVPGWKNDTIADVVLEKRAMGAIDFIETRKVSHILSNLDKYSFAVGHNRAASRGKVTNLNAHPFQFGDITLVHNGTLTTWDHLPDGKDFIVDSEAITYGIAKEGAVNIIEALKGSFTLVWSNIKEGSLNFVRNSERPLYIGWHEKSSLLFASEAGMLRWIASRNGLKLNKIEELPVGEILSVYPNNVQEINRTKVKLSPIVNSFKNYSSTGYNSYLNPTYFLKEGSYVYDEVFPVTAESFDSFNKTPDAANDYGFIFLKDARTWKKTDKPYIVRLSSTNRKEFEELKKSKAEFLVSVSSTYYTPGKHNTTNQETCTVTRVKQNVSQEEFNIFANQKDPLTKMLHPSHKHFKVWAQAIGGASVEVLSNDHWIIAQSPQWNVSSSYRIVKDAEFKEIEGNNVIHLPHHNDDDDDSTDNLVVGPGNKLITLQRFKELTKNGCAMCTADITEGDAPYMEWTFHQEPICPDCEIKWSKGVN